MAPSAPIAFSCGFSVGSPPGSAARLTFAEFTSAFKLAAAAALNDAIPIAFRLAAIEAMSDSFAEADAESTAEARALAAARAEALAVALAFSFAVAEAKALTAAVRFGIGGSAGGKLPCNPANASEQMQPTVHLRILRRNNDASCASTRFNQYFFMPGSMSSAH